MSRRRYESTDQQYRDLMSSFEELINKDQPTVDSTIGRQEKQGDSKTLKGQESRHAGQLRRMVEVSRSSASDANSDLPDSESAPTSSRVEPTEPSLTAALNERAAVRERRRQERLSRAQQRNVPDTEVVIAAHVSAALREDEGTCRVSIHEHECKARNELLNWLVQVLTPANSPEVEQTSSVEPVAIPAREAVLEPFLHLDERRITEISRDLVWAEKYDRLQIIDDEQLAVEQIRRKLKAEQGCPSFEVHIQYRAAYSATVAVERTHRADVELQFLLGLERCWRKDVLVNEAARRGSMYISLQCTVMQQDVVGSESASREVLTCEESNAFDVIVGSIRSDISEEVERELWRTKVAEANARIALEKEEVAAIELFFDGKFRSRDLVNHTIELRQAAESEMKALFDEQVKTLSDTEHANRVEIRRESYLLWETMKRDEQAMRAALDDFLEKRTAAEVEAAIQAAQAWKQTSVKTKGAGQAKNRAARRAV